MVERSVHVAVETQSVPLHCSAVFVSALTVMRGTQRYSGHGGTGHTVTVVLNRHTSSRESAGSQAGWSVESTWFW